MSGAAKRSAAEAAVAAEVRSGMTVGLGSGSTAAFVVIAIGERLRDGRLRDVVGVPTSEATAVLARTHGIPLATLAERPRLAVCLDGADEIGPGLALTKGLGGALLREKVVAVAADRFVVVVDESKCVGRLGERAPLPVEVIRFAEPVCARLLAALGGDSTRRDGFTTDEGNVILDCRFDPIEDPDALATAISAIPGVAGHGLFVGMAAVAYVASATGVDVRVP